MAPKSDQHLMSPFNISTESNIKAALDCWTNSPCQHFRKCIENSMENMHTDARVQRVEVAEASVTPTDKSSSQDSHAGD